MDQFSPRLHNGSLPGSSPHPKRSRCATMEESPRHLPSMHMSTVDLMTLTARSKRELGDRFWLELEDESPRRRSLTQRGRPVPEDLCSEDSDQLGSQPSITVRTPAAPVSDAQGRLSLISEDFVLESLTPEFPKLSSEDSQTRFRRVLDRCKDKFRKFVDKNVPKTLDANRLGCQMVLVILVSSIPMYIRPIADEFQGATSFICMKALVVYETYKGGSLRKGVATTAGVILAFVLVELVGIPLYFVGFKSLKIAPWLRWLFYGNAIICAFFWMFMRNRYPDHTGLYFGGMSTSLFFYGMVYDDWFASIWRTVIACLIGVIIGITIFNHFLPCSARTSVLTNLSTVLKKMSTVLEPLIEFESGLIRSKSFFTRDAKRAPSRKLSTLQRKTSKNVLSRTLSSAKATVLHPLKSFSSSRSLEETTPHSSSYAEQEIDFEIFQKFRENIWTQIQEIFQLFNKQAVILKAATREYSHRRPRIFPVEIYQKLLGHVRGLFYHLISLYLVLDAQSIAVAHKHDPPENFLSYGPKMKSNGSPSRLDSAGQRGPSFKSRGESLVSDAFDGSQWSWAGCVRIQSHTTKELQKADYRALTHPDLGQIGLSRFVKEPSSAKPELLRRPYRSHTHVQTASSEQKQFEQKQKPQASVGTREAREKWAAEIRAPTPASMSRPRPISPLQNYVNALTRGQSTLQDGVSTPALTKRGRYKTCDYTGFTPTRVAEQVLKDELKPFVGYSPIFHWASIYGPLITRLSRQISGAISLLAISIDEKKISPSLAEAVVEVERGMKDLSFARQEWYQTAQTLFDEFLLDRRRESVNEDLLTALERDTQRIADQQRRIDRVLMQRWMGLTIAEYADLPGDVKNLVWESFGNVQNRLASTIANLLAVVADLKGAHFAVTKFINLMNDE